MFKQNKTKLSKEIEMVTRYQKEQGAVDNSFYDNYPTSVCLHDGRKYIALGYAIASYIYAIPTRPVVYIYILLIPGFKTQRLLKVYHVPLVNFEY